MTTDSDGAGIIPARLREQLGAEWSAPESLWPEIADDLSWFSRWDAVLSHPGAGRFTWFPGATTNLSFNCLDRIVSRGDGDRTALIFETGERDTRTALTYEDLKSEVEATASMLWAFGVRPEDTVLIYMPTSLHSVISMLACIRIGAIHTVVSTGFGSGALAERIEMSEPSLLLTADAGYRDGERIDIDDKVVRCLEDHPAKCRTLEYLVSVRRGEQGTEQDLADRVPSSVECLRWSVAMERGADDGASAMELSASDPAMVMYTSGTTGRPKGVVHNHGGYQVFLLAVMRWLFGVDQSDVVFVPADIGWAVSHGYGLYGPLLAGASSVLYEGVPTYPDPNIWWRVIERHGVSKLLTSPSAIRSLRRAGSAPGAHALESLAAVYSGGEPLNAPARNWLQSGLPRDLPVINYYGQTETGGAILGNPMGLHPLPIKPGTVTVPLPGIEIDILGDDGERVAENEIGSLVITSPFPGLTPSLLEGHDRYLEEYWNEIPGTYVTGDLARVDEDGYVSIVGRRDDVITISGHRIGPAEVENAILGHEAIADAVAVGRPHREKTEVIVILVELQPTHALSGYLRAALEQRVADRVGPIAVIDEIIAIDQLPKTETGKLTRQALRRALNERDSADDPLYLDGSDQRTSTGD